MLRDAEQREPDATEGVAGDESSEARAEARNLRATPDGRSLNLPGVWEDRRRR